MYDARSVLTVAALVALVAGAAGCTRSRAPSGESESHFLMACQSQACGDGLSCVCGVCTASCVEDTSCAALATRASCGESLAAACDGTAAARTCELACEVDADCDAGHASLRCVSGLCQPRPSASGSDAGPYGPDGGSSSGRTCGDVRAEFTAKLAAMQACDEDADCGQPVVGTSCGCTQDLVVRSDAERAELDALLMTTLDGETCVELASDCSCPAADGFVCRADKCAWNYLDMGIDPCPNGEIVDDLGGCLQDDAFCNELPDGRYCTGSAAPSCPLGSVPLAEGVPCPMGHSCWAWSESLMCVTRELSVDQCEAMGGVVEDDAATAGPCPDGMRMVGRLQSEGSERCCSGAVTACAPQQFEMTGDCELAPRYFWDGSACQPHTGCDCLGPDCEAGFGTLTECRARYVDCQEITTACGGSSGQSCAADDLCAYTPGHRCASVPEAMAICQPRPQVCDDVFDEVCGCNGVTYPNACEAQGAGQGIQHWGACD